MKEQEERDKSLLLFFFFFFFCPDKSVVFETIARTERENVEKTVFSFLTRNERRAERLGLPYIILLMFRLGVIIVVFSAI